MWLPGFPSLAIRRQARTERSLAIACIAVSAAVGWLLPLAQVSALLFSLTAVAIAVVCCHRVGWLGIRYRIVEARLASGGWILIDAKGRELVAELTAQTRVMSRVIWLHWRCEFGTRQMLLAKGSDSTSTMGASGNSEEWRRAVVGVRWAAPHAARSRNLQAPLLGADGT